ncbi:MAG: aldose epimerase family protein [Saonia sp.]
MKQITIKNDFISLTVLDYGAIIQKLQVKDKYGNTRNVVVGYENPLEYINDGFSLGACIGRYAGRISKESIILKGKTYPIYAENGIHLHGGKEGFGKKYWTFIEKSPDKYPFVELSYLSPDMEEGYPGNLKATVTYKLLDNALHITHKAITDKTTVVNLTNHSYFQLDDADTVDHYKLYVNSSQRLEICKDLIPTGKHIPVLNSDYDFLSDRRISKISLDTPYIIDDNTKEAAKVYSDITGIHMQVTTNQPAMVLYTPKSFPAICFETQNYPDAPNKPHFPSSILHPGETYYNHSVFEFGFVN